MAAQFQPRALLISRWASRDALAPRALEPGYVGIDERGFADTLADIVHFGRFVRFFDGEDQADGTWEALLASDATVVLALLATLDLDGRSTAIEALTRRIRREPEPERKE
jgi:hypothetical protein